MNLCFFLCVNLSFFPQPTGYSLCQNRMNFSIQTNLFDLEKPTKLIFKNLRGLPLASLVLFIWGAEFFLSAAFLLAFLFHSLGMWDTIVCLA